MGWLLCGSERNVGDKETAQSCHMTEKEGGGFRTLKQEFSMFPKIYKPSQSSRRQ
jgi:hypothetical protein